MEKNVVYISMIKSNPIVLEKSSINKMHIYRVHSRNISAANLNACADKYGKTMIMFITYFSQLNKILKNNQCQRSKASSHVMLGLSQCSCIPKISPCIVIQKQILHNYDFFILLLAAHRLPPFAG
jgi:hypothetical protein